MNLCSLDCGLLANGVLNRNTPRLIVELKCYNERTRHQYKRHQSFPLSEQQLWESAKYQTLTLPLSPPSPHLDSKAKSSPQLHQTIKLLFIVGRQMPKDQLRSSYSQHRRRTFPMRFVGFDHFPLTNNSPSQYVGAGTQPRVPVPLVTASSLT